MGSNVNRQVKLNIGSLNRGFAEFVVLESALEANLVEFEELVDPKISQEHVQVIAKTLSAPPTEININFQLSTASLDGMYVYRVAEWILDGIFVNRCYKDSANSFMKGLDPFLVSIAELRRTAEPRNKSAYTETPGKIRIDVLDSGVDSGQQAIRAAIRSEHIVIRYIFKALAAKTS